MVPVDNDVTHAQAGIGFRVVGVDFDRPSEERVRPFERHLIDGRPTEHRPANLETGKCFEVGRPALRQQRGLGRAKLDVERADDLSGYVILHGEDVGKFAVIALGPDMSAAFGVVELNGHPDAIGAPADAALEYITDSQFLRDLAQINGATLVGEARIAGDDEEAGELRQRGDNVFRQSVGENLLLGIVADIGEGEDRERGRWRRRSRGRRLVRLGRLARADEAIADAGDRRDPLAAVGRRTKKLPNRGDLNREVALLDGRPRPPRVHEIGLGDHLARTLQKSFQEPNAATSDGERFTVTEKRPAFWIEQERSENEALPGHCGRLHPDLGSFWDFFGAASIPTPAARSSCFPRRPIENRSG